MGFWSHLRKQSTPDIDDAEPQEILQDDLAAGRYCRSETVRYDVGNNSHLVYSFEDVPPQILPSYQVELLNYCQGYKTLDEHAEACELAVGLGDTDLQLDVAESIKDQLAHLVQAGMLISEHDLLERCRRAAEISVPPPKITTIGVVTANRIFELERCLTSYMESCQTHGRTPEFVVMDDSDNMETRGTTREMLVTLKKKFNFELFYGGKEEKTCFARELIKVGDLPPEVVNFALFVEGNFGFSGGKNRNALALETVGELFYSTDDDIVCQLAVTPDDDHDDAASGMRWLIYPDRETALASARFVDEDPLRIHELLLGKDLVTCIAESNDVEMLRLGQWDAKSFRLLQAEGGRVMVTFPGIVGDSGVPAAFIYRTAKDLSPDTLERVSRSHADYLAAVKSREVLRLVSQPSIGRSAQYNTSALAYDNRDLLPPFNPMLRGEDYIFGYTLQSCFENALFGDLPWAILHAPTNIRLYSESTVEQSSSHIEFVALVIACMHSKQFWYGIKSGRNRMYELGQYLMELGSLPLLDYEEFVRLRIFQTRSGHLNKLEAQLDASPGLPDYWIDDVNSYLERTRDAMLRPTYVIPNDVLQDRSIDDARQLSQQLVWNYGRLLTVWPEIVETAKSLRKRGHRLASQI